MHILTNLLLYLYQGRKDNLLNSNDRRKFRLLLLMSTIRYILILENYYFLENRRNFQISFVNVKPIRVDIKNVSLNFYQVKLLSVIFYNGL